MDFVADNPGLTLFHCHQQLHMDYGALRLCMGAGAMIIRATEKSFWTEPDLAFFPVRAATDLESERHSFAFFAETNLSACGFGRQITLFNDVMARALQLI